MVFLSNPKLQQLPELQDLKTRVQQYFLSDSAEIDWEPGLLQGSCSAVAVGLVPQEVLPILLLCHDETPQWLCTGQGFLPT